MQKDKTKSVRSVKCKIAVVSVFCALLLTAVITCLQLSGVWDAKAAECGETVSVPMYATSNEQIALSDNNDYQEYSKTHESGTAHIRNSLNFRTWYAKRPVGLKEWTYTLKLKFECKETTCTTSGKEFGFTYGFVYQEDEYVDEGDGEYSMYSFDANSIRVKNNFSHTQELRSRCDSKATTKFPEYTSPTFAYKHTHGKPYDYVIFTLTESKFSLSTENATTHQKAVICEFDTSSDVYKQAFYILNKYALLEVYGDSDNTTFSPLRQKATVTETMVMDARVPVALPENPTKEGHAFAGWYYGTQAEHGDNCRAYGGEPIYSDTALHAHFNINKYTVTYRSNGGEEISSETVDWNTAASAPTPERIGYNFMGWVLADGSVYNGAGIKQDTTLEAKWEIKIFTVTFYADGNETYATLEVPYGTTLAAAMEQAELSAFSAMTTEGVKLSKQNSVITEDAQVLVTELSGWEKYGDFVANNAWYTWTVVGVGCALIAFTAFSIVKFVKGR